MVDLVLRMLEGDDKWVGCSSWYRCRCTQASRALIYICVRTMRRSSSVRMVILNTSTVLAAESHLSRPTS